MIKKDNGLVVLNYLIASTIYFISTAIWGMTNNIRYAGLLFAICANFIILLIEHYKTSFNDVIGKNFIFILLLAVYLIVASIIRVKVNQVVLSSRVWIQTAYLVIPALYAFTLVNLLNKKIIINLVKYTFLLKPL